MPNYTIRGVKFTEKGLVIYAVVRQRGGLVVRFAEIRVPWEHFDDSDAWALYSRNARLRAEADDGADEPSLPLDWS